MPKSKNSKIVKILLAILLCLLLSVSTGDKMNMSYLDVPIPSPIVEIRKTEINYIKNDFYLEFFEEPKLAEVVIGEILSKYQINTYNRIKAFLGNVSHETLYFKKWEESLAYSHLQGMSPADIAYEMYGGRFHNETKEDALKYIGRGGLQLTFKYNYERYQKHLGATVVDVIENPEIISNDLYYAFDSAGWFWESSGLNELADVQNYSNITRIISGGTETNSSRMDHMNNLSRYLVKK